MAAALPKVDKQVDFAEVVRKARRLCDNTVEVPERELPDEPHLAVITPGRLVMLLSAAQKEVPPPPLVAAIRGIVPEEPPLQITVIASTDVVPAGALDAAGLGRLIPFTGYLMGMAYLGHNVIAFEGHPSALASGCQDADLLIVDEPVADLLQPNWPQVAARTMRRPRILLFCRNGEVGLVHQNSQRWMQRATPQPRRRWWPF